MKKKQKKKFKPFLELKNKNSNSLEISQNDLENAALNCIRNLDYFGAEKIYTELVSKNSKNSIVYANLAGLLQKRKMFDGVEELLKKAIAINPNYADAYSNLGVLYHREKKIDQAINYYKKALSLKNNYPEANFNLGNAYCEIGEEDKALFHLEKAVEIKVDYLEAHLNLAELFARKRNLSKAIYHVEKITNANIRKTELILGAGRVFVKLELFYDAIKLLENVLKFENSRKAMMDLITLRKQICDWDNYSTDFKTIKKFSNDSEVDDTNSYMYFEDNPETHFNLISNYANKTFHDIKSDFKIEKRKISGRKIRIGYISADFREHPVTKLIYRIIELHDKERFEVFAYSIFDEIEDQYTRSIKNSVDKFINLSKMNDYDIASTIREDKLDIAIDLMGYSKNSKPKIFAYRVSPIQISYLGYPATTGAYFMDYIVADKLLIPDCDKKYYSEKVLYLNQSPLCCDDRFLNLNNYNLRKKYGFSENGFIFACFNNNLKICPSVFKIWMEILQEVKNSYLWLYGSNEASKDNLLKEANNMNISGDRIKFAEYLETKKHIERHSQVDLFIDTFNFSAGATAIFAILSGTPIVTLYGKSYYSRMSSSLLASLDLKELITDNQYEYKSKCIELAMNNSKFSLLKEKLLNNLKSGSYLNSKYFVMELETKLMSLLK